MKPMALDLCCGKGGWAKGLLATGWNVIGVDIEKYEGFPDEAQLILCDVRGFFPKIKVDLIVASPPCQEFSKRALPFKVFKNLPPPDTSIWEACVNLAKQLNCPIVIENVCGAQKYMGKAKAHYGSFYLWGDIDFQIPVGKPRKGFVAVKRGKRGTKGMGGEYERPGFRERAAQIGCKAARKEFSANAAVIPMDLARAVGEHFKTSKEQ